MKKITNTLKIANKTFELGKQTYIWGILNITPNSFFDGGKHNSSVQQGVEHALQMIEDGADIIDIGGQSTHPGYKEISPNEELDRILPVIQALKKQSDVPLSVDTYFAHVAQECLKSGVDIINDIWGLKYDDKMANVVAKYKAYCCVMHNSNIAHTNTTQKNIENIIDELDQSLQIAQKAGIAKDKIILDPGVGFAKDIDTNWQVLKEIDAFKAMGYPILLALSNKSLFSKFGLDKQNREEATIASSVFASQQGIDFVRVHNVKKNKQALLVADELYR